MARKFHFGLFRAQNHLFQLARDLPVYTGTWFLRTASSR